MTKKKPLGVGLSREERMLMVIGEIIQDLVKSHDEGKDVNLNKLKTKISSKYGLETTPRLVDIIAAVPNEYKKSLLPKLKAKPIRTASGVSHLLDLVILCLYRLNSLIFVDCCCCCNVQASQMSSHKLHWKYLCLLSG